MLFVIVEYPDITFGTTFLAKRPGSTVDVISEPPTGPPNDRRHQCIALVQGLEGNDLKMLVTGLKHMHENVETMQQDLRRGRWLGRFQVRERALQGTATIKVLRFQQRFGAPWAHSEGGLMHLRARVVDPTRADHLAEDMRKGLAEEGIDAQVEIRELDAHDYGAWDELVQHAIGLHEGNPRRA